MLRRGLRHYILGLTRQPACHESSDRRSTKMSPRQPLDQRIAKVLEPRPEVLEAYLFGSHARGTAQPHSDIDIAVYVDQSRVERRAFGYRAQLTTELIAGLHNNDIESSATAYVSCLVI